jgi:hypothetical protein
VSTLSPASRHDLTDAQWAVLVPCGRRVDVAAATCRPPGEHDHGLSRQNYKPSDRLEPSTPPYHGGIEASRAGTRDHRRLSFPANRAVRVVGDASRDVARVVSDVSVLCPRAAARRDNMRLTAAVENVGLSRKTR